jgi:cobyrinic acid a,c-diamide synthase
MPDRLKVLRLVIAGTHSGAGKTTLVTGLLAALRARGQRVQPFKAGPDYIDPTYHTLATGRVSRNLDTWMLGHDAVLGSFARGCRDADVAVVEGVMGLYDGFSGSDEDGSTAQLAKWLGAPVILALDVRAMARSAAAVALGFRDLDPELNLMGFVLNRVGSDKHAEWVAEAIEEATGLPVLGALRRDERLQIPERHLGLVPTAEPGRWESFVAAAGEMVDRWVDIDRLLDLAREAPPLELSKRISLAISPPKVRIGVARDEAFSFYYEDNFDLLRAAGAELVPFSPLHDKELPAVDGLYIGGGFPEVYAEKFARNVDMLDAVREAHAAGMPIYAECGGLMALAQALIDDEGETHEMAGLLPGRSRMGGRLALGYREATALRDTLLLHAGESVRGHEFHYSAWDGLSRGQAVYALRSNKNKDRTFEGYATDNLMASYIHLHFAAKPELATRFVGACLAHRQVGVHGTLSGEQSL